MTRVYSHPDPSMTALLRGSLADAGIDSVVRGERPGAALGEIPPIASWSELWVPDDAPLDRVQALVRDMNTDGETAPWACACGEQIDGAFGVCWSCGAAAPDDAAS